MTPHRLSRDLTPEITNEGIIVENAERPVGEIVIARDTGI
jgi:hypothetical protein